MPSSNMPEKLISKDLALKFLAAPRLHSNGNRMVVRSVKKLSAASLAEIQLLVDSYLENDLISYEEFQKEFEAVYPDGRSVETGRSQFRALINGDDQSVTRQEVEGAPIVQLVDQIISRAIESNASDIHLECREKTFGLRYRLDGVLQEQPELPFDKKAAVISRIKIMADLDIAERRRPQDGRIRVECGPKAVDLRVSIIPTDFGEKVAIRILDKGQLKLDLDKLGMEKAQIEAFKEALGRPNGIILVTGPTGSGKTTTLYAALNYLKSPRLNILTIEDPIEYNLGGINQSQVKREIGYDFASALRTFLRQDPDVILVGEIRDQETAEIAIRASLTGHLVLSTLHTNDAASAITRLIDIGIEPYLVSSSLNLVVAQRLVRELCPFCKQKYNLSEGDIEKYQDKYLDRALIFKPQGCPKCFKTGFSGRTAVFELMAVTDKISAMIHSRQPASKIRDQAVSEGMLTLRQAGQFKMHEGITSQGEIERVT
jgi:type IV pilus assembly protein PilB